MPDTKPRAAAAVEAAGARHVDVAVMAPVQPRRHRVPMLLSGPQSAAVRQVMVLLDMHPEVAGKTVG